MKLHCRLGDSFIDVWLTNGPDQEQQIGRLDFSREPDGARVAFPWRIDVSVHGERIPGTHRCVKNPPALYGDENAIKTFLEAASSWLLERRNTADVAMDRACSASAELAGWKMMADLQKVDQ